MKHPRSSRTAAPQGPGRRQLAAVLLAVGMACSGLSEATQPLKQNLSQMIAASDLVVSGTVMQVSDGIEAGLPYTQITLRVKQSLRKNLESGSDFSFRQYGLLKPRQMANGKYMLPMQIEGFPTWRTGEQVVVFLNKPASQTGLRSPVGLSQGKFTSIDGRMANAQDNQGLFEGVELSSNALSPEESSLLAKQGGPVDEALLMNIVSKAINGQWIQNGVMR